tara:strand:- start:1121 stop:1420 length:300 start_codon:yes stop_codon:yes gene_type:complete
MTENTNKLLAFNKGIPTYYPSNMINSKIINAFSGIVYDDKVGSNDEKKYFRVIESSGRYNHEGFQLPQGNYNPNSNKLFYENKEEWLQHLKIRKINPVF